MALNMAFLFCSISEHVPDMQQNVGYCPQFDALDSLLTVEEILYCYSRLKGINSDDIDRVCV